MGLSSIVVMHEPINDHPGDPSLLDVRRVADRQILLISSANLTANAFDLNIELGVLLTGGRAPEDAASNIDELIRCGVLRRQ